MNLAKTIANNVEETVMDQLGEAFGKSGGDGVIESEIHDYLLKIISMYEEILKKHGSPSELTDEECDEWYKKTHLFEKLDVMSIGLANRIRIVIFGGWLNHY